MFRTTLILLGLLGALLLPTRPLGACTSILVTRTASATGSPMISYSCDGEFHPRLGLLPAADYPAGAWYEIRGWDGVKGRIPQVPHTWKVVGLMNEHQLSLGETTFGGREELMNPEGYFDYYPLMLVTLQRARNAREAIDVFTSLAERWGYCGEGESITIADTREVWLLEIVGTGKGGKPAWVALRIPDGMVCATANRSRIHTFPLNDPENCRYSANVITHAEKMGYYQKSSGKPFSFSEAYNPPSTEQIRYSDRRIWSLWRRLCPSADFSPEFSNGFGQGTPYPLWIKPDKKVGVRDVIALHRDHYEGTPFDMTRDLVAGPFGSPDRWRPMKWTSNGKQYLWERPIATQQSAFVSVSQARADLPAAIGGVVWYGVDAPDANFFVPIYTGVEDLPPSYTRGDLRQYTPDSAWWVVNFVANYANLRYSHMIQDIRTCQKELEDLAFGAQDAMETAFVTLLKTRGEAFARHFLTRYCTTHAESCVARWRTLGEELITRYNDGFIQDEKHRPHETGYPQSWLDETARQEGKRRQGGTEKEQDREL